MKTMLSVKEVYRIDTEEEVKKAIEEVKAEAFDKGYTLKGYSSKLKEKKAKGEIIDQGYEVTFTKEYDTFWG